MDRRLFLQYSAAGFTVFPLWGSGILGQGELKDTEICSNKFELAVSLGLRNRPINEVIIQMGISFLGTEYVAHALEVPGPERLVVNMRGLDCVSFYENALVLARCIKKNTMTFDSYRSELTFVRYRGGVINGYTSRLHYTSDYFFDGHKKGIWTNVTKDLGGIPYEKTLHFMSTHPESYRQLKENPEFVEIIRAQEQEITARDHFYIPKEKVRNVEESILSGDILGITTDIEGLDTSHTGIAVRQNGQLHLMHAPLAGKKVEITALTLAKYLERNKRQTGLLIVRANEP